MGANDCCCGRFNAAEGTKIIGIASVVISALSMIGFIWRFIQLEQIKKDLNVYALLSSPEGYQETVELLDQQSKILGGSIGVTIVCLLVAVALIFAARKKSGALCLPFMIWTIVIQIANGIFACVLIFFCAVSIPRAQNSDQLSKYVQVFVVPLVFSIIMFVLNTWWLIVVFAYYRLLKSGHAFDSIPMQTA